MIDALDIGMLGRRRVRLVAQTEFTECGLASLAMVANYHGMRIDLATLRRQFEPSLRGTALRALILTADGLGMTSRALKIPLEYLRHVQLPAILHWDMNHYVVLETVRGNRLCIHDPEGRTRWMSFEQVSDHFTGFVLELKPADDFDQSDQRVRIRLSQLWGRTVGLKRAVAQTLALSVVMQIFVLVSPFYMQIAVDSALPALDHDLLLVLALGFGMFTVINAVAALLRSFVLLSAGTALGYGLSVNVARRLFQLPVAWFEKRHIGDILSRFQSITPIRKFMTEGAVGAVLDGGLVLLTLLVMFFYSATLTLVALAAFLLYGAVRLLSFAAQRRAEEDAIMLSGREQSTMIETMRGIVTLRLFNRESARQAHWQNQLVDAANASVAIGRIAAWQTTGNTFIFGIETILSTWLAVSFVINGGFSVGMVFAYMAYKTLFLQRSASFIDKSISFRMLGMHLERLADIALTEADVSFAKPGQARQELEGRIELRKIRFRYNPAEPLILNDVDLVVEPGEHVAITGASGGGKSTLIKVLLGLLEPEDGEVLLDGVPIGRYGYRNFREQIGVVLQEDSLFAGSLAENVALFDDRPDMARIVEVTRMAALHDDVVAMPMGYETLVGDMGSSLSGGQKQRLLLARALYRKPRMLVMDEGTSALDAARETEVNASIARLGITRIIIAHRLETIVSAQRIYAATDGQLQDVTNTFRVIRDQMAARTRLAAQQAS